MKFIYGPVPSRRLGFSLGVDIVPYKTCTLDCIYCQLGKTTDKSVERRSFFPQDEIINEIEASLNAMSDIDFVTFSGSGEPTLNSDIGSIITTIKNMTSIPVALLTNGTLIFMQEVRADISKADVVLPSLDAVSQSLFKRVNRPHSALNNREIISGLVDFRTSYRGQIWLEIMLVKHFNDSKQELEAIKQAVNRINPDRVYLNTVIRPPSERKAEPLNKNEMDDIREFLGKQYEVIGEFHHKKKKKAQDVKESIVAMTARRPVTVLDIANVLGISGNNAAKIIERLITEDAITEKRYGTKTYYVVSAKKDQRMSVSSGSIA